MSQLTHFTSMEVGRRKEIISRQVILLTSCYFIPFVVTITLLVLNFNGYYIGGELSGRSGEDHWKLFGLYVATITFCLSIVASLWHIDRQLARDKQDNLPPISVPSDADSLLPIKDSTIGKPRVTVTTICLVIFGSVLLLTNPTSVVVPDLQDWNAGGTHFWINSTVKELWPTRLEEEFQQDRACAEAPTPSCFPSNIEPIGDLLSYWPSTEHVRGVMPQQIQVQGRNSMRKLQVRLRGSFDYQPPLTVATLPSAPIADSLSTIAKYWSRSNTNSCILTKANFCYYNDIRYFVTALQPVVYAQCNRNDLGTRVEFPRLDQGLLFPAAGLDITTIENSADRVSTSEVTWVELPEAEFGRSSVGVIISSNNVSVLPQAVYGCTIDARWANATAEMSYTTGPMIVSGSPVNWFTTGRTKVGQDGSDAWTQVKLSPIWAETAFSISGSNISSLSLLESYLLAHDIDSNIVDPTNAVEAMLVVLLADAMSRTTSTAAIQGELKDVPHGEWMKEMLPRKTTFGPPGNAFQHRTDHEAAGTKLTILATVNGYGYGCTIRRLPAIVLLCVYLCILIVYVLVLSYHWFANRRTR